MQVIWTKQGQPVAIETVSAVVSPPTCAREVLGGLTQLFAGYAGWDKPTSELVEVVEQAVKEVQAENEVEVQRYEAFHRRFCLIRWYLRLQGRAPRPTKVRTRQQILAGYVGIFKRFASWMRAKQQGRFYADSFHKEIPACDGLVLVLEQRVQGA